MEYCPHPAWPGIYLADPQRYLLLSLDRVPIFFNAWFSPEIVARQQPDARVIVWPLLAVFPVRAGAFAARCEAIRVNLLIYSGLLGHAHLHLGQRALPFAHRCTADASGRHGDP